MTPFFTDTTELGSVIGAYGEEVGLHAGKLNPEAAPVPVTDLLVTEPESLMSRRRDVVSDNVV
jgi:hypothetical protein